MRGFFTAKRRTVRADAGIEAKVCARLCPFGASAPLSPVCLWVRKVDPSARRTMWWGSGVFGPDAPDSWRSGV